jgi:outer membrane protein assembly factor BamA
MAGTLSLRALTGSRRQSLGMQTRIDRLFRTWLTWQLSAGWQREEIHTWSGQVRSGTYEDERYTISAAIGQQVQRMGLLTAGIWAEDVRARTIDGLFPVNANLNLRGFVLRTVIDSQDRLPFPTSGVRHEFLYETTPDIFGSVNSYVRLFLSMESFTTFGRHTLHPRIIFGTADATLPFVNWFRLGGMDTFYGYARDQIRGRQVFLLSGEYRFRIPWRPVAPVHLSMRYDWGGGWNEADKVAFSDLISGIGFKVSLDTPIGPLEAAWGLREGGHNRFYAGLGFHF